MDKILKKLRRAQLKAESMRSITPVQQDHQASKICKVFSFPKYAQIRSLGSCFTSHSH
ncbi:remorin-like, partial [Trifolium medium]|nr:remorin-like [Trifolium medium]